MVQLCCYMWNIAKSKLLYSGESQLATLTEAPTLPTFNADTTQAWDQYSFVQQHGATDSTDGLQVGCKASSGMFYLIHIQCTCCN